MVSYWTKGRRRFYALGPYGRLTLHQAKSEALGVFLMVRRGEDPAAERLESRKQPRMTDLADRHISDHAKIKNKPKSVARDRRAWDRCVLPRLGKRRVKEITRGDVARVMTEMAETPAMANKALTPLSKAFDLAEVWGWRPEGSNPCRHVSRYKEESRERYLSEPELRRLGSVLNLFEAARATCPYAIAAIRLLTLTGCRSAEVPKLRWEEVDFERRCLHLSDSKTGKRTILLNGPALASLDGLQPVDGNPWVFPGEKPGTRRRSLQAIWERIRNEAEIPDARVHDLRHSFASFGVNGGQNLAVVGRLLGHTKITTTQQYAHLADDPVRKANESIGLGLAQTLSTGGELSHDGLARE
ncbi:MAG: site-specific integrase [Holophagales bacterium]|nr:site-specific integrase [Holophagales bacterium]